MTLIRVADYLQIHSERAPEQVLRVKTLKSPISQREWDTHHSVEDINSAHDDPEALYVKAVPANVADYLRLKNLFTSIQVELDSSWAILGEIYGRFGGLSKLGLTIRRIRSNLDDEKQFALTVNYVPSLVRFDSAGADLLKLLIQPLYGNNPGIGVRELLQNAVDACRELEDFLKEHSSYEKVDLPQQNSDVLISLDVSEEKDTAYLTVSDRGIGMTADVIRNYFLRAGASFRKSDVWRQQHTTDEGETHVLRSGRFGVGALAAFLLGDRISVTTRHVTENEGIEFECGIDDDVVELQKIKRPVGTTIKIKIGKKALAKLQYPLPEWYYLAHPSVVRLINGEVIEQTLYLPQSKAELPFTWRRINHIKFTDIQWSFWETNAPQITCNGIKVGVDTARGGFKYGYLPDRVDRQNRTETLSLQTPKLSIFDPNGHLPLNLQRDEVIHPYSFDEELKKDVIRDFLAFLLVNAPESPGVQPSMKYLGLEMEFLYWFTDLGSSLPDPWHYSQVQPKSLIIVPDHKAEALTASLYGSDLCIVPVQMRTDRAWTTRDYKRWFRVAVGHERWVNTSMTSPELTFRYAGRRVMLSKSWYRQLRKPRIVSREVWQRAHIEWDDDRWTILTFGDCPKPYAPFEKLAALSSNKREVFMEWYPARPIVKNVPISKVAQIWHDVLERPVIPYSLDERRQFFRHAYQELEPYIEAHEKLKTHKKDERKLPKYYFAVPYWREVLNE